MTPCVQAGEGCGSYSWEVFVAQALPPVLTVLNIATRHAHPSAVVPQE